MDVVARSHARRDSLRQPPVPPGERASTADASSRPWLVASGLLVALVLAPIGGLVFYAAKGSGDLWPHLIGTILPTALWTTLLLLAGVGTLVAVVGVGTAWLVAMYRFPGRKLFEWALLLPLAVPTYIVAYAYLDVLHPIGPVQTALRALFGLERPGDLWFPEIRSLPGAILLLGFVLYPYVYLPARALFLMQSPALVEVARTLGAGRNRVFFKVALPLARPAVAVGTSLALMEALNDIGASEFLGVRTLTVAIYSTWVTRSSIEGAAQIALVMLAFVVMLVTLERTARRRQRFVGRASKTRPALPIGLTGGAGMLATLACALPIAVGFLVPAAYLVHHALIRLIENGLPDAFAGWVINTVTISAGATVACVTAGLVIAYTGRFARHRLAKPLVRLSGLGYAVPGTVLAAGMLMPFAAVDNAIADLWRAATGERIGLVLSSLGVVLVVGYVIRFLAVSSGGIEAGLTKIPPTLDMAARSLGARPGRTVASIHVPLLKPAIAASGLLVFVDCMKELPLTLMLRPFNFETLATTVYGEAARGTYEDAAIAALMIVVAGLAPVILLARSSFRDAPKGSQRERVAETPVERGVVVGV
ncbi:ABC transporter permease [Mongoliimonas terrestris]|uniref:ABC transporter permease n=1 Tax=Mongoliimonas terrestris TaxID=1709001 RepID=UPI0009FA2174|nr:iron ABC transporter permease [Mongoliimonas terrestris]